jgi:hypothetical protein
MARQSELTFIESASGPLWVKNGPVGNDCFWRKAAVGQDPDVG